MKDAVSRPPARRRGLHRCLALAAAVFLGLLPAVPAQANPSPAEIEAMIDKQWRQLEPTIEQFNKVRSQLKANQQKAAKLEKEIQPLTLQTELAMAEIGEIASRYYKTGPTSNLNALLTSGSPTTLAEQLSYLDRLAQKQQAEIAGVTEVRDRFAAEKAKIDKLIAEQKKQQAELDARRKQIDAEIKRLERMLPKTTVKVAGCPTITGVPNSKARTAVSTACAQVGKPYVWGANGPNSFDCSGLTQYAWKAAGVRLTHYTGAQWKETYSVSNPLPGDLVFFFSDLHHVGLYIGDGLMVHAPRAGKPVQVTPVRYIKPLAGYKRVRL
ncbi:MAG TPA: NlpC/P60 family protein [Micromonosporaceae bacterium]|nr:NlpC/P60 family protein [Micromonosporaceae bacterium]